MNKITCYQRLVQAIVNNAKYGEDFEYEFESFPGFTLLAFIKEEDALLKRAFVI